MCGQGVINLSLRSRKCKSFCEASTWLKIKQGLMISKHSTKHSNLALYQLSSNLKKPDKLAIYNMVGGGRDGAKGGGKVDFGPDIRHQATFTMQMVNVCLGGNLLILYDSGALTSGVNQSVAHLGSKTIRKGPVSLTVVGGGWQKS